MKIMSKREHQRLVRTAPPILQSLTETFILHSLRQPKRLRAN